MKTHGRLILVLALLLAFATASQAQESTPTEREPAPGAALGAAIVNVAYLPIRLCTTVFGGLLGGFTGLMTAGNLEAAGDVWELFDGQDTITPAMMQGQESLRFGQYEFQAD
jgi:hypothetical protein